MPADILIVPNKNSTTLNPNIQFSGSAVNTIRLEAQSSGSVAFVGNSGSLFSVVDNLSGSLMAVSDVSGLPILEVFSDDRVVMGKFNSNTLVVTGSRVGIGKAKPNEMFDVNGNTIVSGSLNVLGDARIGLNAKRISIYDDGNGHIHSTSGPLWLNAEDGTSAVNINNQYNGHVILTNGTGNVGIATSSPGQKLDVIGRMRFRSDGTVSAGAWYTDSGGTENVFVGQTGTAATSAFGVFSNSGWRFAILNGGNVGIGTITPSAKLNIYSDTADATFKITPAGTSLDGVIQITGEGDDITVEGLEMWYQNTTGDAHISTTFTGTPSAIRFHTRVGASKSTSNERFTIYGDGNIGINKATPSAKLDVNGNTIISGSLVVSGSQAVTPTVDIRGGGIQVEGLGTAFALKGAGGTIIGGLNASTVIGLYAANTYGVTISTNSTWYFYMGSNGRIAIGANKSSLNAQLDVDGNTIISGSLTMTGSFNPMAVAETYTAPSVSSNVVTVDLLKGTVFNVSLTANVTSFTISNPTASRVNSFTLFLTQDGTGGRTVTWTFTSRTLKWAGGTAPTVTSTANKGDVYSFISNDGGSTWYGFVGGQSF